MTNERFEEIEQYALNLCTYGLAGVGDDTLVEVYVPELVLEVQRLRQKLEAVRKAMK